MKDNEHVEVRDKYHLFDFYTSVINRYYIEQEIDYEEAAVTLYNKMYSLCYYNGRYYDALENFLRWLNCNCPVYGAEHMHLLVDELLLCSMTNGVRDAFRDLPKWYS